MGGGVKGGGGARGGGGQWQNNFSKGGDCRLGEKGWEPLPLVQLNASCAVDVV